MSRVRRSFGKCSGCEENVLPGGRVCVGRLGRQEESMQVNYKNNFFKGSFQGFCHQFKTPCWLLLHWLTLYTVSHKKFIFLKISSAKLVIFLKRGKHVKIWQPIMFLQVLLLTDMFLPHFKNNPKNFLFFPKVTLHHSNSECPLVTDKLKESCKKDLKRYKNWKLNLE